MQTVGARSWSKEWEGFLSENKVLQIERSSLLLPSDPTGLAGEVGGEHFWENVYATYPSADRILNLNSGAVSSSPRIVQTAYTQYYQLLNQAPSYYMWHVMDKGKDLIRKGVAEIAGCDWDEIAFLRNATEAINNIIFGVDLKAGDEVVVCKQDYSKTISSWKQRALREDIKIVWVDLNLPFETNDSIVQKFVSAITPRTKLVQVTHVINWNGEVLPVKRIIDSVKRFPVDVLLDGSHGFALLETDVKALGCDYYASPLHKWLGAPAVSAMLYVRRQKISEVWPLASSHDPKSDRITKFEELSLTLSPTFLAAGYAIEYFFALGRRLKEQRLRYLRTYWLDQLAHSEAFSVLTPQEETRSCAIAAISHAQISPAHLQERLMKEHSIHVGLVDWAHFKAIRITPNVYTTPDQLSYFVESITKF